MILGKLLSIIPNILKTAIGAAGTITSGNISPEDNTLIEDNEVIDVPPDQDMEPTTTTIIDKVTPELVKKVFIYTPLKNIQDNLPLILHALDTRGLGDKEMICYALATLYVENSSFLPLVEKPSKYSDGDGLANPKYDFSHYIGKGGNKNLTEANLYRGAGYLQLTLKENYEDMDKKLGLDGGLIAAGYVAASESQLAAAIMAQFLLDREVEIRTEIKKRDFLVMRQTINGPKGLHWQEFKDAYIKLETLFKNI